MRFGWLAATAMALAATACAGPGRAPDRAVAEPDPKTAAKLVARSIWGVVPTAPKRKQDLRPELIRGSAVAIGADRLLVGCAAVGRRNEVGLVRQNKYRKARVVAADPARRVCTLAAIDAPLNPAAGYRALGDLRPNERVLAFASRTPFDLALVQSRLAAPPSARGRLVSTLELPEGAMSAVLFDAHGNLLGIASGNSTLATPLSPALAPRLASRELGPAAVQLASAPGLPEPRSSQTLFHEPPDRDDDAGPEPAAAEPEVAEASGTPAAAPADTEPAQREPAQREPERAEPAAASGRGGIRAGIAEALGGLTGGGRDDRGRGRAGRGHDDDHGGRGRGGHGSRGQHG